MTPEMRDIVLKMDCLHNDVYLECDGKTLVCNNCKVKTILSPEEYEDVFNIMLRKHRIVVKW